MYRRIVPTLALVLGGAFLSPRAAAAQAAAPCSVESVDPVHLEHGPAYRDCDVQQKASKRREPRLNYGLPQDVSCAIAELEFVIDTTGVPDTSAAIVVIDANSPEFVTYLRRKLGEYRFKPATREGQPVRQVYRLRVALQQDRLPITVTAVQPGRSGGTIMNGGAIPPQNRGRPSTPGCR